MFDYIERGTIGNILNYLFETNNVEIDNYAKQASQIIFFLVNMLNCR